MLHLHYSFFTWQVIGNAIIKQQRPYKYALVLWTPYFDPKNSTQTSYFNVDFDVNGLLFLFLYFKEVPSIQQKTSVSQGKFFVHPIQVAVCIYCGIGFSNYVYLKYIYITLKGTGKILFVSVSRILLICKFLNFTDVFAKNYKLFKVQQKVFRVRKLISV